MTHSPGSDQDDSAATAHRLVQRVIGAGWGCVLLSALFLYLSRGSAGAPPDDPAAALLWAGSLMLARLFGIGSFAIGGIAIFNHRWTMGIALLLLSIALPFVAYSIHGTF